MGKVWAAPVTVIGLAAGGGALLVSAFTGKACAVEIKNNAVTFTTSLYWGGSVTLGNVIIHAGGNAARWNADTVKPRYDGTGAILLGKHEEAHTRQYQRLGVLFFAVWGVSALVRGGIGKSVLEIAADDYSMLNTSTLTTKQFLSLFK
ncbi:MAG: hypothetical protein LBS86_03085 [Treponema sp.]|nr:hypothetical protein [Treponema sp.]